MDMKIFRNIHLRVISILMCLLLAVIPFFHPKKVNANPAIVFVGIISILATGMIAGKYVSDTVLTQEQINNANDYCTANLQTAFPDPAEYNKQLTALQNLDNDIRAGKDIDWSKYSGKALYAVLKGVVDVVWPVENLPDEIIDDVWCYLPDGTYITYLYQQQQKNIRPKNPVLYYETATEISYHIGQVKDYVGSSTNLIWNFYHKGGANESISFYGYTYPDDYIQFAPGRRSKTDNSTMFFANLFSGSMNSRYVPNITAKTANKIKLPTRLPQTVINNINSYIDNSTENLIIAPTADELPQLPEGYNPNTDELSDLPGYEDVTPDQEPTTDPEPTPTPPEYNGNEWVNPIGNFFDGLLKFMKAAFVPTLSLDLSALSNMPENFTDKFPFSLPSDIVSIFGVINADPVAPSFSFTFPLSYVGGEDMDASFNLDNFNDAAAVIRSLLLLVVVVLLAWKTYGLVGGDS